MGDTLAQRLQSDRLKFPGLLPAEVLVLKEWLRLHESEYDYFDYNVRLGSGLDPGDKYPPEIRRQAIMNSQKRLDAVGFQGSQATIIEAKRRAAFSNIGQLVGYRCLWVRDHPEQPTPYLILAATAVQTDLVHVAQEQKIQLDFVEVDFGQLRNQSSRMVSGHKHA
jgi:hypothetical protein